MRPEIKHPKELKELKETTLTKRRKEVIMQTFPCFMQSIPTFERKGGNALKRESLRLPQMPDNGLHFRLQESVATRIVMHTAQFLQQLRATVDPSVKGLDGRLGTATWLIKQSQFGLAISTGLKYKVGIYRIDY